MNFKKKSNRQEKFTSAINSAALQDHFLKKFNYNLDTTFKTSLKDVNKPKTFEKLPSITKGIDRQINKLQSMEKKTILPYESEKLKKLKQEKTDTQKMHVYNKNLTWAQKLGLIQAPPLPLTAKDWKNIEQKSKVRGDSQNCCSICLEDFKIEPQTLLSCSHVFHLQCLSSYERHNKVRCCPICRRKDYERKVIDEALRAFTLKSIIRIQRTYRGSKARIKLYKQLVEKGFTAKSTRFNRRLIGYKMWRLSHRIQQNMKKNEQYLNKLLNNIEKRFEQNKEQILDEIVEGQRKRLENEDAIEKYLDRFGIKTEKRQAKEKVDWEAVKEKGVSRKDEDCSICLMKLWTKPVCLLSCTHLFHANCIEGFERYAIPGNHNKCPCCRSTYQKKLYQIKS